MMPIRPAGEFPSIIFLHVSFFNIPMAFILSQHLVFAIAQTQTSGQEIPEIILTHISSPLMMLPTSNILKEILAF